MSINVIEISTEVFRRIQHQAPHFIGLSEEKRGPTQKVLLEDDVYSEFIDRAIVHRQTLDQVVYEACTRPLEAVVAAVVKAHVKRVKKSY